MNLIKKFILVIMMFLIVTSCGVEGDPGHCYFSLDWEYYSDSYRVYFYSDNNPDIPESNDIERTVYYDCYPGSYEYYYESEDENNWYSYTGVYTLVQNPGYPGGLFQDGLNGADTYFDLFLMIYAKKGLVIKENSYVSLRYEEVMNSDPGLSNDVKLLTCVPNNLEERSWEETRGQFTLSVNEFIRVYEK
jgi:hypothetical protein